MPKLIGDRIMLREYRADDLIPMRSWVNDPEIVDQLSDIFLYPQTEGETETFLHTIVEKDDDHRGFVIAFKDTEAYIGQIDLFRFDWKNRSAEMGIVIGSRSMQRQGYGSEAIRLLQRFVFERLGLNRLQLEVYDFNRAAIGCYLKNGFREEGRLRERHYFNGRYCDVVVMSILKREYDERPSRKTNPELP